MEGVRARDSQKRDVDFKWLFRLFEASDGGSLLDGSSAGADASFRIP